MENQNFRNALSDQIEQFCDRSMSRASQEAADKKFSNLLEEQRWQPLKVYKLRSSSLHRLLNHLRPRLYQRLDYSGFFYRQLLERFTELESEFRSAVGKFNSPMIIDQNSYPTCQVIVELLGYVKEALDRDDIRIACNLLPLIDRYMFWIYSGPALKTRSEAVLTKLKTLKVINREQFVQKIEVYLKEDCSQSENLAGFRGILDEALRVCHEYEMDQNARDALQIRRLKALRFWVLCFLVPVIIAAPLLFKTDVLSNWKMPSDLGWFSWLIPWLDVLLIALMGAVGGLVSGLFQARSSRISFRRYEETITKLTLKPIAGALVAVLLTIFLSWGVVTLINPQNGGAFILVAFLAGFSERYFIQALTLKTSQKEAQSSTNQTHNDQPVNTGQVKSPARVVLARDAKNN